MVIVNGPFEDALAVEDDTVGMSCTEEGDGRDNVVRDEVPSGMLELRLELDKVLELPVNCCRPAKM